MTLISTNQSEKASKKLEKGVDKWNLIWYNNQAVTKSDNKIWSLEIVLSRFRQKPKRKRKNKFQKSVDKQNSMWYNNKATWKRKAREKLTGLWKLNNANKKTRNCFEWCNVFLKRSERKILPPKVYRSEDNTTNVKR